MVDIPVYLFTGFLESGKTKFIQDIMEDERFNSGEKTLLLLCEEGEEEYDVSKFYGRNVNIKVVENESDLTEGNLKKWLKENNGERVVIEYNGMWMLRSLFENMPRGWQIYQTFSFADYTTFKMYNQNMRSLVFERLSNADTVIFNRVPRGFDMMEIHQIVRAINTRINIAYEYTDGETEYDQIEDPLPFDLDAPVVEIADDDFALFYRDIIENEDNYNGKTVKFKGIIAVEPKFGKGVFAIGR
ncbi:MAG: GTPase, partial [Oscillospiraceae bacterium]|nr:GTPase [Oscillospiraceae bacterium]